LIIDVLYRTKNIKLTISLELLFRRIANNKSMQKIMYFSLNPVLIIYNNVLVIKKHYYFCKFFIDTMLFF